MVHSTNLRESQKLLEKRCHQSKVGGPTDARENVPLTNKWVLQVQWVDTFLVLPFLSFFSSTDKMQLTPNSLQKDKKEQLTRSVMESPNWRSMSKPVLY